MAEENSGNNKYLACSRCGVPFEAVRGGIFACPGCREEMRIEEGVYYTEEHIEDETAKVTIEEFGRRWNRVWERMGGLNDFYLPMMGELRKEFFKGKVVVDAGGGYGRLTKIFLDFGAEHVVLLDCSEAVKAASLYLKDYRDKVTIVRGNLLTPPLARGVFDIAACQGVLHHTGDPAAGVKSLASLLKPHTGALLFWVYAAEGNSLMSKIINLFRIFSLRIGDRGRWLLAGAIDFHLWLMTTLLYRPAAMIGLKKYLWYGEYFLDFLFVPKINNRMDRMQMYHDFLTSGIVEYYSRQQLEEWIRAAGICKCNFHFYRKQSLGVCSSFNPDETFSGE